MDSRLAGAIVFVASGAVLVLEILAGRLLAPYVGVSLETFTGIIGVVLAGIAIGTWAGGRLADRFDPRQLLPGALTLGGAAAIAAIPIIRALGPEARPPDPPMIVFLAATGFFLPSALLSSASPLVVKVQLASLDETGRIVGRLSALGTAGSLVGVFTTGFVLVAEFPTTPVVLAIGGVLVAIGVALWWYLGRRGPARVVVAGALVAVVASGVAVAASAPCDVETAYFCASVRVDPERPSGRTLVLDDLRHAYVDLADPTHLEFAYTSILGDVVDAARPAGSPIGAVHLGGGGFTIPRYIEATRPGSDNLVLELDPGVVSIAEDELGLRLDEHLRVDTGDARVGLRDVAVRLGRPRRRGRVRGSGGAVAPHHAGVRHRDPARAEPRRDLRPEHHRPAAARLPAGRRGNAARRVRPRRRDRTTRSDGPDHRWEHDRRRQ